MKVYSKPPLFSNNSVSCATCGAVPATFQAYGQATCAACERQHRQYEAAATALSIHLQGPLHAWSRHWLAEGVMQRDLEEIVAYFEWNPLTPNAEQASFRTPKKASE